MKCPLLTLLLLAPLMSGCAALQIEKGISLENSSDKSIGIAVIRWRITDAPQPRVDLRPADISIGIDTRQELAKSCLTFGPGILLPLPLIPNPWGIHHSFKPFPTSQLETNTVCFRISFFPIADGFSFDPNSVSCIRQGQEVYPSSTRDFVTFAITNNEPHFVSGAAAAPRTQQHPPVISLPRNEYHVFELTFDLPWSDLIGGELQIRGLTAGEKNVVLPPTYIRFKSGLVLEWHWSMNG